MKRWGTLHQCSSDLGHYVVLLGSPIFYHCHFKMEEVGGLLCSFIEKKSLNHNLFKKHSSVHGIYLDL